MKYVAEEAVPIERCGVQNCAYNVNGECHAKAITVGDGDNPRCDTYFSGENHTHSEKKGVVGACKVAGCIYNHDFQCNAPSIQVDEGNDPADCLTYRRR